MTQPLSVRSRSSVLDDVYDAVLLELAVMHPRLSDHHETRLKARLLEILDVAQTGECEPGELMWLFREAMHEVGQPDEEAAAPPSRTLMDLKLPAFSSLQFATSLMPLPKSPPKALDEMIEAILLKITSDPPRLSCEQEAAFRSMLAKNNTVWLLGDDLSHLKVLLQAAGFSVKHQAATPAALRDSWDLRSEASVIIVKARDFGADRAAIEGIRTMSDAPVVVMAETVSLAHFRSVLEAGADGYLELSIRPDELQTLLALIIAGEKVVPGELAKELLNASRSIN